MHRLPSTWSLILAAGEGSRLQSLTTTPTGKSVPKQFCSLNGGASLLHDAIQRAATISSPEHVCAVVAAHHRQWWQQAHWPIANSNIIVQPENRGTTNGILLPLLHILDCDPTARVVLLPSDHYLEDESALHESIGQALTAATLYPDSTILLGIEPEEADPELGYIVPNTRDSFGPAQVSHFVEKPNATTAHQLIEQGALWNAFILVARATTLLALFMERYRHEAFQMQAALLQQRHDATAIEDLYKRLPNRDFSRHILQGMEHRLRVVQVRKCGWSDLGTPKRVLQALQKTSHHEPRADTGQVHLNLAWQHAQQKNAQQEYRHSISQ